MNAAKHVAVALVALTLLFPTTVTLSVKPASWWCDYFHACGR